MTKFSSGGKRANRGFSLYYYYFFALMECGSHKCKARMRAPHFRLRPAITFWPKRAACPPKTFEDRKSSFTAPFFPSGILWKLQLSAQMAVQTLNVPKIRVIGSRHSSRSGLEQVLFLGPWLHRVDTCRGVHLSMYISTMRPFAHQAHFRTLECDRILEGKERPNKSWY